MCLKISLKNFEIWDINFLFFFDTSIFNQFLKPLQF